MSDDREKLEEAITAFKQLQSLAASSEYGTRIWTAAEAHLATLPREKTIEVWHVHYAHRPNGRWQAEVETRFDEREANWRAAHLRELPAEFQCISVTGPHLQMVPAE